MNYLEFFMDFVDLLKQTRINDTKLFKYLRSDKVQLANEITSERIKLCLT